MVRSLGLDFSFCLTLSLVITFAGISCGEMLSGVTGWFWEGGEKVGLGIEYITKRLRDFSMDKSLNV